MTLAEFKASQSKRRPPAGVTPALAALWWAGREDWDRAHKLVMDEAGADCAWVHAYLHRLDGDLPNARYWYGKARRPPATGQSSAEWQAIATALLAADTSG
jgi:hypothetical protein